MSCKGLRVCIIVTAYTRNSYVVRTLRWTASATVYRTQYGKTRTTARTGRLRLRVVRAARLRSLCGGVDVLWSERLTLVSRHGTHRTGHAHAPRARDGLRHSGVHAGVSRPPSPTLAQASEY